MMADYAIQIYPNLSMTLGTSVIHELRISFGKRKVHGMMPQLVGQCSLVWFDAAKATANHI